MVLAVTEVRLILSVLDAYKQNPPVPWHITRAGWEAYANHMNPLIREATLSHPHCPDDMPGKKDGKIELFKKPIEGFSLLAR